MASALLLRVLPWILAAGIAAAAFADDSAEALFRKGHKAQRLGRHIEAYLYYNRARALDPANILYSRAARNVRRGAAQLLAAAGEHRTAIEMAPDSWEFRALRDATQGTDRTSTAVIEQGAPVLRQPVTVSYSDHEASFRFRGSVREAYEKVAAEFGVQVLFDEGFQSDRRIRADLDGCDFRCALRALGHLGDSFVVPVAGDRVLVAADDSGRRAELEPVAVAALPLDGALTQEDVSEIGQAIQQVLEIKKFQATVTGRAMVLRDSAAKINMARELARNLLQPRAEVQIEIRLVTLSSGKLVNAGIALPTKFPITQLATAGTGSSAGPLITLGGGRTALGIGLGDASLAARLEASSSQAVQTVQLRAVHGMPAEFHVGERFPIATGQYSSGAPTDQIRGYAQPPPVITFEDLGLKLAITPRVHSAFDTTLDVEANFQLLAGGAVNEIPILSNREFKSQVRLRRGEFAIVSGMAVYESRHTNRSPWGLGSVPWLGSLFGIHERRWNRSDLLILVRPHLTRLPPGELARTREFLFGSEERPLPAL